MEPVEQFRAVVKSRDIETFANAALALRKWMIASDPHRPIYHFTGPESWINDPNGPIYHQGKYHLFYQYDPIVEGKRHYMCWGHAVSADLVHWRDWPVAIWPDTPEDRAGVFSGNTVVDDQGRLCALYTGNVAGHQETYGILARSGDGLNWEKKVVMRNQERINANSPVHWDGFLWRDGELWHQLIGGATAGEGPQGAAMLWTSPDLERWTFRKNIAPSIRRGGFWELPYLIAFGAKHVLLVGNGNPYWVGTYDTQAMLFTPDDPEPRDIDAGNYYSFNLNMTDDKGPDGGRRQLMHGWVTGPPSPTESVPYWQGAHSIPRVLSLRDGRVWQEPIPEIQALRGERHAFAGTAGLEENLRKIQGRALEIRAEFDPAGAARFGLKLQVSANGKDFTRVFFDTETGAFGVDGPTIERNVKELPRGNEIRIARQASFLPPGAPVSLHVFLDRSIVEVYVNGSAYTARVFAPEDARGLETFSEGGEAALKTLEVWEMRSIW